MNRAAHAAAHQLAGATDVQLVRHSLAALVTASDWLGAQLLRVNRNADWPMEAGYTTAGNAVRLHLPPNTRALTAAQRAVVDQARRRFGAMLEVDIYTSWRARAWVVVLDSVANGGVAGTEFNDHHPIRRDGTTIDGMRVCHTGVGRGTSCGRVLEVGYNAAYGVANLARTNYCSADGDSGGPVFASGTPTASIPETAPTRHVTACTRAFGAPRTS